MIKFLLKLLLLCVMPVFAAHTEQQAATTVMVLGVDHAVQLVAPDDSPAHLAAFLQRARPRAICIERSPDAFAAGSYYEFTYEVQDVAVPFAREHGIDLCPIDWEPAVQDALLGFGMDVSSAPAIRPASGFQRFLSFTQPSQRQRRLYHADTPENLKGILRWTDTPTTVVANDLPRRMFLYRTFLQAKRLASAAKRYPGETVVLVVGEFHKRDIENILSSDPLIRIVQPSTVGQPTAAELADAQRPEYAAAIASFNLLGVQSMTDNVNWAYVGNAVRSLRSSGRPLEAELFETRLAVLSGTISTEKARSRYAAIASKAGTQVFTWTGVLDGTRLDSYFDPFGNMTLRQRALLEQARSSLGLDNSTEAEAIRAQLLGELSAQQSEQLQIYWARYVTASPNN